MALQHRACYSIATATNANSGPNVAKAIENDDLSLIQTLKPKDIAKLNKKGIFTITQYAFTFRPRRKRRKLSLPTKHDAALKALSIREQRIYVNRLPAREERPMQVFLYVEGLFDEDLYYLIGLSVYGDGRTYSFWADDKAAEEKMWKDFLGLLSQLGTAGYSISAATSRGSLHECSRRTARSPA